MAASREQSLLQSPTPATRSLARSTRVRFASVALLLLLWVTVIAFASPATTAGAGTFSTPTLIPAAPIAVHGAPGLLSTVVAPAAHPAPATLPGSNTASQSYINGAALAGSLLQNRTNQVQNWSLVASNPTLAAANLRAALLPGPAPILVPAPSASPVSASIVVPTGSVTGIVEQWGSLVALQGVAVQAYSSSGTGNCPINICKQVTTSSTGSFNATAPVGGDYLSFTLSYNLTNISNCYVYQGLTTNIGVIYLVSEAVITGTIEANTSSHPKLAGVLVQPVSRDNTLVGTPSGASNSAGTFVAGLPPVPSIVSFSPPFGYESTFLFENATPGESINIGTVFIQKDPVVQMHLYNAVSGSGITGSCNPFNPTQCNALTICSAITPSNCGRQGEAVGTSTVTAVGPAGYDIAQVWATGYVTDTVSIGYVGYNTGTFNAGNVYLTPIGAAQITTEISHNLSTTLPHWSEGMVYVTSCSMSGVQTAGVQVNPATDTVNVTETGCTGGCGTVGPAFEIGALPLRNDVKLNPDTTGNCAPAPTWPIPSFMPVWGNETWINITPNEVTSFFLNMSAGDYVAGNVTVQNGQFPTDFTVTPVAIDNSNYATYPYAAAQDTPSPCSSVFHWLTAPGAFCVAVPPGASEIRVQTALFPYEQNFTWGSAPSLCCSGNYPESLAEYTSDHALSINLTALGTVSGSVAQAGTDQGVFFAAYSIQAAGTNLNAPTFSGAISLNGTIKSPAPLGWDAVTVSASGFSPNTVWVNVTGNDSFGTIYLTPLATIAGRVVDPYGNGLLGASVYWCAVTSTSSCTVPLGAGLATTDGGYNGTVPGLWLPYSSYEIYASSSGYTSDWTWVNATAGQVTIAPNIVLYPATESATHIVPAAPQPFTTNPLPQTYLSGYLIDNSTGQGLQTGGGNIQACSTATGACFAMLPGSNSQGEFNNSIPLGTYNLEINVPGYLPSTEFVNASAGASHYLGVIELFPLPWVTGLVGINPFGEVTVKKTTTVSIQLPEVPAATAMACNANSSICGASLQISSNGSFTVQAPAGTYDKLQINPSGGSTGPSSNGGFNTNDSTFNASANSTTILSAPLQLAIYVAIGGVVVDNNTTGPGGITPWLFVPGASVSVSTFGPSHSTVAYSANLGGEYLIFVPPDTLNNIFAAGTHASVFTTDTVSIVAALPETDPPMVTQMPTLGLEHFGWIQAEVVAANGTPAAFLSAGTTLNVGGPVGSESGLGSTNAWGQLNATAPPGTGVVLTVGPANDYNVTTAVVDVNASVTTIVNGGSVFDLGVLVAAHWGWATSAATNYSYAPVNTTVLDLVHQLPLPDALITVASSDTSFSGSGTDTNWAGQYVTDAPIGNLDTLAITRTAALSNNTHLIIGAGTTRVQPVINLTGVGILAGEVVAYPSDVPVPGATVQTCPYSTSSSFSASGCYTATTNASGDYWVPAYPGQVSIQTSAIGYVENSSAVAKACSDCWTPIAPIVLSEFSYISGFVRGLPSGLPLTNANVSVCSSVGGNPVGVCDFTVYTDINGHFLLEAPAGSYNMVANATGFNASIPLPVTLHPGQVLPIGTIFLEQFGTGQGAVLSSSTLLAVGNASVYPCASWSGGGCLPTIQTSNSGTFTLYGPPGTYTLTVVAPGYLEAYDTVTLTAGVLSLFQPILLTPLGTQTYYPVSGEVVNGSNPGQGLLGVAVIAEVNGTPEFTGETNSAGVFQFNVLYGVYNLIATLPGYAPENQTIVAHGPVSGVVFSLSQMTFLFSSSVTDGLTGTPLAGTSIALGTDLLDPDVLGVADSAGAVSFALPNGTYTLTAWDPASTDVSYAPVTFTVAIAGGPVVHNLQLDPPSGVVRGVIVDSYSGIPLPGASITIHGTTIDGVPVTQTTTTNQEGVFSVTLTQGTYNASTSVAGYSSRIVPFTVTAPGGGLSILLTPLTSTTAPHVAPSGSNVQLTLYAIVGLVIVASVLGTLLLALRRPAKTPSNSPATARANTGGKR